MELLDLLTGATPQATSRLQALKDDPQPERLLWYPSAGIDLRDLFEFGGQQIGLPLDYTPPTLFVHTDYAIDFGLLSPSTTIYHYENGALTSRLASNEAAGRLIYEATILSAEPLIFVPSAHISYEVNPQFAEGSPTHQEPRGMLLEVCFMRNNMQHHAHIVYLNFENINFLSTVLLRYHVAVSHLLKVREGCGFGGNKVSMALCLGLLPTLGVEWLAFDDEGSIDYQLLDEIYRSHNLACQSYTLGLAASLTPLWSGMHTRLFGVKEQRGELSTLQVGRLLGQTTAIDPSAYQ